MQKKTYSCDDLFKKEKNDVIQSANAKSLANQATCESTWCRRKRKIVCFCKDFWPRQQPPEVT